MFNQSKVFLSVILLSTLLFSACASLPSLGQSTTPGSNRSGAGNAQATISPETVNAIGILKLEGTAQAVTVDQAKILLPLYQAAKSMSANAASAPVEIQALYSQINDNITPAQADAIKQMDINPQNMRTIMSDLGIQFGNGGGSGTRTANGGGGGFPGGPGGPGGFGGGGVPGSGGGTGQTRPTSIVAGASASRQQALVNPALLTAVIDILSKRAGVASKTPSPVPASLSKGTPAPESQATATPAPVSQTSDTSVPASQTTPATKFVRPAQKTLTPLPGN